MNEETEPARHTHSPQASRRSFVKQAALGGFAGLSLPFGATVQENTRPGKWLTINAPEGGGPFAPLVPVVVNSPKAGTLAVRDGLGREYVRIPIKGAVTFATGGALGNHLVTLENRKGQVLDVASFRLAAQTEIRDRGGAYEKLLSTLYWTMTGAGRDLTGVVRYRGKFYTYFVPWVRDHVHTLKGMKYFAPELKSGMDLYADSQREDGMIWDNIYTRDKEKNWWDKRFRYANFILPIENETYEFHRIPVEADVEYLFIEGLYYTWKATGDDAWMASRLDHALKAVTYSTTDPYRWSKKYELIKRGFTIDTWDFQAYEDTLLVGGDIMVIDKDKTRFGVMFGDNTGMAVSCRYLAEMLVRAGRPEEAARIRQLGENLRKRVDDLAWNGNFYTHHVPEDPTVKRDLDVDQSAQVSLSNAYSLNRDLSHEQCVAIIKTYQGLREQMPPSSPGEWYTIYPPFGKGFGTKDSTTQWEYMNGGVTPIVAGELAHGAFEHGFETYGVDILNRLTKLAAETDDYLHCTYRGAMPDAPQRNFTPLALDKVANVNYPGKEATYNGQWIGHSADNAAETVREFEGIPFRLLNPDAHPQTCIEVNDTAGHRARATVPVRSKPKSVYVLHTMTPGKFAGTVYLHYADGTAHADYITDNKIGHWWRLSNERYTPLVNGCRKAWRSNNDRYVAFYVYGFDNPFPDKTLDRIEFVGAKQPQRWQVLAVTLSDHPVFFMPDKISHGIPDNWGAAAVVYALVEGLAGIKDTGVAFDKALLSPRWEAAGVAEVAVTAKYEASGGYLSYRYGVSPDRKRLELTFTGSGPHTQVEVLLPADKGLAGASLNDKVVRPTVKKVENSTYAVLPVDGLGTHRLVLELA